MPLQGFDVLILAGGKSRRMGIDKAGIVLGGKTLLEHTLDKAVNWGGNRILVAGPPRNWVEAEYIPDPPQHQPCSLRGLYGGLLASSSPWTLVAGCDMPFIKSEVISHLWALKNSGGAVAWWRNRRQPFPGFYPRQGLQIVAAMLEENRFHLAALLDRLQPAVARNISLVDPEGISFFNINTPEELDLAEALGR